VTVPFIGLHFDFNDLGIISALAFSVLLILLWTSLHREAENLKMAHERIRYNSNSDNLNLLMMSQVLARRTLTGDSAPQSEAEAELIALKSHASRGFALLMMLPIILHGTIWLDNYPTLGTSSLLQDGWRVALDWMIGLLATIIIAYMSYRSWKEQVRQITILNMLELKDPTRPAGNAFHPSTRITRAVYPSNRE
jgi:hypothetical protein